MAAAPPSGLEAGHEIYLHIRVIISIVLGIAITRLLSGMARFIQHPGKLKVYPVHLIWVLIVLVSATHFWWWEFGLSGIAQWRFETFWFVLLYAYLFALMANLLFPDALEEYSGYRDYFLSRRGWFFGLFIASMAIDLVDTALKGPAHLAALGTEYPIRLAAVTVLALIATRTRDNRYQLAFASLYLIYYVSWIIRLYDPGRAAALG